MHGWETRMLLKHYLERGVSKTELSRRFGVSRRTIRGHRWATSWIPTRGSSTRDSRSTRSCRRGNSYRMREHQDLLRSAVHEHREGVAP